MLFAGRHADTPPLRCAAEVPTAGRRVSRPSTGRLSEARSARLEARRCRTLAEVRQEFFHKDLQSETGYAGARNKAERVGLTSMMSSHGAGTGGLPMTKHGIIDQVIPNRNGTGSPSLMSQLEHINRKEQTWRERRGRSRLRRPGRRRQRSPNARRRPRAASRDPSRLPGRVAGRSWA
jgi:hypothetical protein